MHGTQLKEGLEVESNHFEGSPMYGNPLRTIYQPYFNHIFTVNHPFRVSPFLEAPLAYPNVGARWRVKFDGELMGCHRGSLGSSISAPRLRGGAADGVHVRIRILNIDIIHKFNEWKKRTSK